MDSSDRLVRKIVLSHARATSREAGTSDPLQQYRRVVVTVISASMFLVLGACGGGSPSTPPPPPPPVPAAPSNLTATAGDAQVVLAWTASMGATSYNVLRSTTNGGTYLSIAMEITTTNYTDTTAVNGTTYYYAVQAVNAGGTSGNSNQVSATPSGELQSRVTANASNFYVYQDQDAGLNHGFPSGFFGSPGNLGTIHLDAGCIDDPGNLITGCYSSTDTTVLDIAHGTVLRISFDAQTMGNFAGVNIEEPQNWGVLQTGTGYDLRGASSVSFDVRSPDNAQVQFSVGESGTNGCTTSYTSPISSSWTTMTVALGPPDLTCVPDLSSLHIMFGVATNDHHAPQGATVLLDNIRFTPVPPRTSQGSETLSLPLSTQTFGVVPQDRSPFPFDQVIRNVAAIYESSATIQALLAEGDASDAQAVADAFDYALYHDNEGWYLSTMPGGTSGCYSGNAASQCGLHNAYESGDIALLNDQNSGGTAKAGDSRLAGFTCGSLSPTGFCLVLDGATGGNNAWVILAVLAEYKQSGNAKYLTDAITIGNWIIANLKDTTGTGFGGYYAGYPDQGVPPPKPLNLGKSTENNADIFAAFSALAAYDTTHANAWTQAADIAGDFVMQMFDSASGRFNTGTVPVGTPPQPGVCPTGTQEGNDVINTNSSPDCDFLDSDSFTLLAMAGAPRYFAFQLPDGTTMDWRRPAQYVLNTFAQTITASGHTFQGFDIVSTPLSGANGIAWEFTGQVVEMLRYIDGVYQQSSFESQANSYLAQIEMARALAPFSDNQGIVGSTLQGGDVLPPLDQCVNTPFQNCPPERIGLAATTWMFFAERDINPLAIP